MTLRNYLENTEVDGLWAMSFCWSSGRREKRSSLERTLHLKKVNSVFLRSFDICELNKFGF